MDPPHLQAIAALLAAAGAFVGGVLTAGFQRARRPRTHADSHRHDRGSAVPLKVFESDFSADSSGFTTSQYHRWFSEKYGRERSAATWIKAHIMVGTRTNVVTTATITHAYEHDGQHFRPLLERTARRFTLKRVSADKACSSSRILAQIESVGAQPLVPFKKNATGTAPYNKRGRDTWTRAFRYFSYHREEFLAYYHQRSNVETSFHMIKSKFGTRLRSKSPVAQVNELLCKILCHNLCCLVQSFYELGVEAEFWKAS